MCDFMTAEEYFGEDDNLDDGITQLEDLAEDFEEECRELEEEFDDNHHAPRKMRRMNMRNAGAKSASSQRKKRADKDLDSV